MINNKDKLEIKKSVDFKNQLNKFQKNIRKNIIKTVEDIEQRKKDKWIEKK